MIPGRKQHYPRPQAQYGPVKSKFDLIYALIPVALLIAAVAVSLSYINGPGF